LRSAYPRFFWKVKPRNIAARSELGKGHPERLSIRHSIVNFSVSGLIFGRGRRPKKPRRSGAAKWEETPSQTRTTHSLAESSRCVQLDFAFSPSL
jgi:hypothetical protein